MSVLPQISGIAGNDVHIAIPSSASPLSSPLCSRPCRPAVLPAHDPCSLPIGMGLTPYPGVTVADPVTAAPPAPGEEVAA